jgi:hypothetical protein
MVGVSAGLGDALTSLDGVGVGVVVSDGVGVGRAVAGGVTGGSVGGGVTAMLGVGVGAVLGGGGGVELGALVGRTMTYTASPPLESVPTTTAWFLTGDCEIDLGRMAMLTRCESRSATGAQSGWRSAGQTSLTFVTL